MTRTTRSYYAPMALALCLTLLAISSPAAHAASILYGNSPVIPPGVQFLGVTESSVTDPVPLFGAPAYFSTGINSNPNSFAASSGGSGLGDTTDGQLDFGVAGVPAPGTIVSIKSINVAEAGDYALAGVGTAATAASASVIVGVAVTHIDGVVVPAINLPPVAGLSAFTLLANPGIVQPWQLTRTVDIEGGLTTLGVPFQFGATGIQVQIINSLAASSEAGTAALIQKKEFLVNLQTEVDVVPEPATSALSFMVLCGLGATATRRRLRD